MERFRLEHFFLGYLQAVWRGFSLRRRLACVLAAVMCPSVAEEDVLEEVDVDEFVLDEVCAIFSPHDAVSVKKDSSLTDLQVKLHTNKSGYMKLMKTINICPHARITTFDVPRAAV